jgi:cell division protein FtsL
MSKALAIKNFGFRRNRIKKVTVSQRIKKGEEILGVFFVAVIVLMSLIYIYQMSSVATNGYEIEKYEDRLANLKKENQKMTIELADLKAMHNLENNNELVAIEHGNVSYITSSSSAVAIQR